MSTTWKTGRLGDVCRIVPGFAFKSSDWQTDGIPVVKIKNITGDNAVDLTTTDCVPQSLLTPKLHKFVLVDGDIIVAMTGATAGKVGRVRTNRPLLLNQRVAKIAPTEADPNFIWAVVSSQEYQEKFFYLADGAAQPNMSGGQIEGVEIPLPPLPIQRRIAGILSAYDELIENSQRRIKILESMARALYREWFVHFRFPGHESVPRVPSPLGEIPKGWEARRIDEALRFDSGRTIKKEERENGNTPVYGANGIIGGTANFPMAEKCIIMGKIGSCGALHRSHVPCWVTNNAFLVQPAAIQSWELAWQALLDIDFRQYIGGAANPYMPINTFGQHEVLVGPVDIQAQFQTRAASFGSLVETLSERINNLRRTRDLLLPRLLSGQIDVEAIA